MNCQFEVEFPHQKVEQPILRNDLRIKICWNTKPQRALQILASIVNFVVTW
jgi:hypothetical protein